MRPDFQIGPWLVQPDLNRIVAGQREVRLEPKAIEVLVYLASRPGAVVPKESIIRSVWPDTFVTDDVLTHAISELRKAFGDDPRRPAIIETIPKRGYRLLTNPVPEERPVIEPSPRTSARRLLVVGGILVSVLLVGALSLVFFRSPPSEARLEVGDLIPLTSYPGSEVYPSFSPDGTQVAFSWNGRGKDNYDIYVKVVEHGEPIRLTHDPAEDTSPCWSPDGSWIAFVRRHPAFERLADIILIPALGGPERKLLEIRIYGFLPGPYLCWSPDSKWLVFVDEQQHFGLFAFSTETYERHGLTSSIDTAPRISPDGGRLAFARFVGLSSDLYALPVSKGLKPEGEPRRLTFENRWTTNPAWRGDGLGIFFVSGQMLGTRSLLHVSLAEPGKTEAVPVGSETISGIAVAESTSRLAYAQASNDLNIWRMELPHAGRAAGAPEPLNSSTRLEKQPQFSPEGRRIAFVSDRNGSEEIWVCDSDGSKATPLTAFRSGPVGAPHWSPDGEQIVFDAFPEGTGDIYVVSSTRGGAPRRLTEDEHNDIHPSWSHDGRWIYFISMRSGQSQLWKMPSDAGSQSAVRLTMKGASSYPTETSDGKSVYYSKSTRGRRDLWKLDLESGDETQVLPSIWSFALSRDGIYFVPIPKPGDNFTLQFSPFTDSRLQTIATFPDYVNQLAVSPDGRWLLYLQGDQEESDLMLADFRCFP